jgi:hypothetical protein
MTKEKKEPGILRRKLRLFALIFAALLVPMVLREIDIDRDALRWVGRIATGGTALLTFYGFVTKCQ